MAQVHQTPHEDLDIWSAMKESGHWSGLVLVECVKEFVSADLSDAEKQKAGNAWHIAGPPSACRFRH